LLLLPELELGLEGLTVGRSLGDVVGFVGAAAGKLAAGGLAAGRAGAGALAGKASAPGLADALAFAAAAAC
jgi:hypothetical protein